MIISDTAAFAHLGVDVPHQLHYVAATCGVILVVAAGYFFKSKEEKLI
jgi:hypothetical protein